MKNKLHIISVFSIVLFFIILVFIIGKSVKPDSFGQYGNYRWNAISEIVNQRSINQDIRVCNDCHQDIYLIHEKDAHYNVPLNLFAGSLKVLHLVYYGNTNTFQNYIPFLKLPGLS